MNKPSALTRLSLINNNKSLRLSRQLWFCIGDGFLLWSTWWIFFFSSSSGINSSLAAS